MTTTRTAHARRCRTRCPALAVGLLATLALAACQNPKPDAYQAPPLSVEERYPIVLREEPVTLEVPVASSARGLTDGQRAEISAFMRAYRASAGGTLVVRTPSGTRNEVAALGAVEEIRELAAVADLPAGAVRYYPYNGRRVGSVNPPVVLAYSGVAAHAAECGDWSVNVGANPENKPYPNYGCASQHNLAAMVSNPRDLETPRAVEPSLTERRQTVREKYILGQPTATATEDKEAGTVSTVGK